MVESNADRLSELPLKSDFLEQVPLSFTQISFSTP